MNTIRRGTFILGETHVDRVAQRGEMCFLLELLVLALHHLGLPLGDGVVEVARVPHGLARVDELGRAVAPDLEDVERVDYFLVPHTMHISYLN